VCLVCDLHEQHGGKKSGEIFQVYTFVPMAGSVDIGYLERWKDPAGNVWWVAMAGEEGRGTVPITRRARSYRQASGVVIPLFASQDDALHALNVAIGQAVDA